MRYLLDTHSFIWALSDPTRLPVRARSVIGDTDNEIFISSVTFWEIAIKARSRRLAPFGEANETTVEAAESMGFRPIPLLPEEAATSKDLPEETHFDPFDRMLIWQAIQRDLVLISADRAFERFTSEGLRLLWK